MKSILSIAWKVLRSLVLGVSLIVLLASWALRTSWFQDLIQAPIETLLGDALGTTVDIGEIDLDLPAHLVIRNTTMQDPKGHPLFGITELRADMTRIPLLNLLFSSAGTQKIDVGHLDINGPQAFIYRSRSDSTLNIDFLSGTSTDTSASKPLNLILSLREGRIRGGQFTYVDSTKSDEQLAIQERINFDNLKLAGLSMDFSYSLQVADMIMRGKIDDLHVQEQHSGIDLKELHSGYYLEMGKEAPGGFLLCLNDTRLNLRDSTRLFFNGDIANSEPDSLSSGFSPKIAANFQQSYVHMDDINKFLAKPIPLEGPAFLEGYVYGTLDHLFSDDLYLGIADSTRLHTSLVLNNLSDPDNLDFDLNLSPSLVSFREVEDFLVGVDLPLAGLARIDGEVKGDLNRLTSKDLHIRTRAYTDIHVRTRIFNYQDEANLLMDLKLIKSKVDVAELRSLLPDLDLPKELDKIGRSEVDGSFIGGTRDFTINANLGTAQGLVDANIHFRLPRGRDMRYDGNVITSHLNVDGFKLVESDISSDLNFRGRVSGRGTDFYTMHAEIQGKLTDTDLMGYRIESLSTENAVIDSASIGGKIELNDRHGNASLTFVRAYFPKNQPHSIRIEGDVDHLDLAHYKILPDDSALFSSVLIVKLDGDSLENYAGKVQFNFNRLNRVNGDSLFLDGVKLLSKFDTLGNRDIELVSDMADMHLTGNFLYSEAASVASRISKELDLYIRNNQAMIDAYYAEKDTFQQSLSVTDTLWTKEGLNDFMAFLGVPVFAAAETKIILDLNHNVTDNLVLKLVSDSLNIGSIGMKGDSMEMELSKEGSGNELLLTGHLESDTLWPASTVKVERFVIEPDGNDKKLNVHIRGFQSEMDNLYLVNLTSDFLPNNTIKTVVRKGSKLKIRGSEWRFGSKNQVVRQLDLEGKKQDGQDSLIDRFFVSNLQLYRLDSTVIPSGFVRIDSQTITLDGVVSQRASDTLKASVSNLDIPSIIGFSENELNIRGRVPDAKLLSWKVLSELPSVFFDGHVRDFGYEEVDSLEFDIFAGWPTFKGPDYAGTLLTARAPNGDSLEAKGSYRFSTEELDFGFFHSTLDLAYLQPFLEGSVSELKGHLSLDTATIKGTVNKPLINGKVHFKNAGMKVDFLNNRFRLGDNTITFDNDSLSIPRIKVYDDYGQSADLYGMIDYNNTAGIFLNLKLDRIDSLTVMDTRREQSPEFYGRVVLDGKHAAIEGLTDLIRIDATLKTGKGSWLDIPLDDFTSANRLDFVTFVGAQKDVEPDKESAYEGFSLLANVEATSDARLRLILDETVGDIIEARGTGNITMKVSETGEFELSGTYNLTEGNYLFTAENIVNKKFKVRPGGRISFNGDPYNAELDLYAVYKVNADVSDLLGGQSNRVPVDILMHMQGSLEEPKIDLSLKLDELNQQDVLGLSSYFRLIEYDEQELNKQVVSLLLFGRFSGSAVASNAGPVGGVTSSVSELISNQVNYWISQAFSDANLGVEVNTNEFQDVELAVRTTLFNDRVTVERNGTLISNQGNGMTIGDLSVQVRLLPRMDKNSVPRPDAGRLVLEIFNREDVALTSATNVTRGAGVFYKKDFDRIADLFSRRSPVAFEDEGDDENNNEDEGADRNNLENSDRNPDSPRDEVPLTDPVVPDSIPVSKDSLPDPKGKE